MKQEILPICIAGQWRLGGGERYATRYPATGEVVAELNAASLDDVEEAVQGAHRAFLTSGWAQRKPHERAAVLHRVADLIRARVSLMGLPLSRRWRRAARSAPAPGQRQAHQRDARAGGQRRRHLPVLRGGVRNAGGDAHARSW